MATTPRFLRSHRRRVLLLQNEYSTSNIVPDLKGSRGMIVSKHLCRTSETIPSEADNYDTEVLCRRGTYHSFVVADFAYRFSGNGQYFRELSHPGDNTSAI